MILLGYLSKRIGLLKPEDFYLRNNAFTKSNESLTTLEDLEKQMIQQALEKNNGNFTAAADQLGVTRQTLYNRLKKSGQ